MPCALLPAAAAATAASVQVSGSMNHSLRSLMTDFNIVSYDNEIDLQPSRQVRAELKFHECLEYGEGWRIGRASFLWVSEQAGHGMDKVLEHVCSPQIQSIELKSNNNK